MLTKGKNESINNINKHERQDNIGKNTTCNRRIEHATTATIDNNRFTPKYTLDIRQEKQNLAVNPSNVHQRIFEAINQIDATAVIITHKKSESQTVIPSPPTKNKKHPSQTKDYVKSQKECTSPSPWNLHSLFFT